MGLVFKNKMIGILSKHKSFEVNNGFYIFSDPRGGSTWLTEIIKNVPHTAIVWEPLHLKYSNTFDSIGFQWRQFIPENVCWSEARVRFEQLLEGKDWNVFSSQMTNPLEFFLAKHLIIKFCRANRLLPWFVNQFQPKYKPVYMVRHPFAVVQSQLKQGGWDSPFKKFEIPKSPFVQFEEEHYDFLFSLNSKPELLTAVWCISNKQTIDNDRNGKDWIFLTYEDLFLRPEEMVKHIFDVWGLEVPISINYSKVSATSKGTDTKNKLAQLSKWQEAFTSDDIQRMSKVLEHFEIKLYSDTILPNFKG